MENEIRNIREGKVVKGKVIKKSDGDLFVDIGYKSEGIVPKEETSRYSYYEGINEGDEIEVLVKRMDNGEGVVLLSRIIAEKKAVFSKVKESFQKATPLDGKVVKAVKGGFIIDFGANVTAFLPLSHARVPAEEILNKLIPLKVIQLDEEKRNVVVSYKEASGNQNRKPAEDIKASERQPETAVVKQEQPEAAEPEASAPVQQAQSPAFAAGYKPGDRINVKVNNITAEGLEVELTPELGGFIQKQELSYFRKINNPADVYSQGQEFEAQIINIDKDKNKVFLSIKRLEGNPWFDMEERYPVDARVFGTVAEIIEGEGIKIEMEENVDAFVGLDDISWQGFGKISEVIKVGDKKEFKILAVDKVKNRIVLGLKALTQSPWTSFANVYKEGTIVDVKVLSIEEGCVICEVIEGINGRMPVKNSSKITCKKGDVVKAKIIKVDKELKKVTLAGRDIEMTEEKKQLDDYMKSHEHSFKMNDLINLDKDKKGETK
ncbi:MAG: S1 RNA-binding domain-containing protein [Candidatus Goldbacteria bacterium]|nr:S1 RNA-binding domain-containing protein [Candidatus Goldiibacteriota bacterium]